MNKSILLPILITIIFISGCSSFNGTKLEGLLGGEKNLINLSYTIAEELEENAFPRLIPRHHEQPILTTTFVNNNDLKKTSQFGRLIQEHMTSRFSQMGYTVKEVKLREQLHIKERDGETMLSRNLKDIKTAYPAQAISVGTYNFSKRTMYISARLVNPESQNIISSVDYKVIMDKNMLAMFGLQFKDKESIDLIDEPRQSFMTWLLY